MSDQEHEDRIETEKPDSVVIVGDALKALRNSPEFRAHPNPSKDALLMLVGAVCVQYAYALLQKRPATYLYKFTEDTTEWSTSPTEYKPVGVSTWRTEFGSFVGEEIRRYGTSTPTIEEMVAYLPKAIWRILNKAGGRVLKLEHSKYRDHTVLRLERLEDGSPGYDARVEFFRLVVTFEVGAEGNPRLYPLGGAPQDPADAIASYVRTEDPEAN